jgi:MFS family permease
MYRFVNYYMLSPGETANYTAILYLPWSPKIVYGFFTDTFPLFGSRKRNYIILMGLVQFICLGVCFFEIKNPDIFVTLIFITSFSGAIMDVVVDGIMVV